VVIKDLRGLPTVAVVFVALVRIAAAAAAAGDLEDGVAAYERGDYQAAIEAWMPLADADHPDALFNMGQLYRMGKGVARDPVMAEYFYRRAAELGHVSAQGNLGTLYYFGFDDSPRVAAALRWWQKAARAGDARSQYMLGLLYYNGKHLPRDTVRAYAWIRKAAIAGLPEAVAAEKKLIRALSVKELAAGNELVPRVHELPVETDFASADSAVMAQNASTPGNGAESPAANPVAAGDQALSGYYVQLGAVSSAAGADAAGKRLVDTFGPLMADKDLRVEEAILEDGRRVYRLLLGAFDSRPAAVTRCARIQEADGDCFVVRR